MRPFWLASLENFFHVTSPRPRDCEFNARCARLRLSVGLLLSKHGLLLSRILRPGIGHKPGVWISERSLEAADVPFYFAKLLKPMRGGLLHQTSFPEPEEKLRTSGQPAVGAPGARGLREEQVCMERGPQGSKSFGPNRKTDTTTSYGKHVDNQTVTAKVLVAEIAETTGRQQQQHNSTSNN